MLIRGWLISLMQVTGVVLLVWKLYPRTCRQLFGWSVQCGLTLANSPLIVVLLCRCVKVSWWPVMLLAPVSATSGLVM